MQLPLMMMMMMVPYLKVALSQYDLNPAPLISIKQPLHQTYVLLLYDVSATVNHLSKLLSLMMSYELSRTLLDHLLETFSIPVEKHMPKDNVYLFYQPNV